MGLYNCSTYIEDLDNAIKGTISLERLKNTSILITGATGTIGSFVADTLLRYNKIHNANMKVYAASRKIENLEKHFGEMKTEYLHYVEYDLNQEITFEFEVDYVIHAAGNAYPSAFVNDPVGTIMGNIAGTYKLLEYARTHNVKKFCYISSGEVYGQGDIQMESFHELYAGYLNITSPRTCYPGSKRLAETLCVSYSKQYGLKTVIARLCHTYGPCITENDNRANVQFFKSSLNKQNIVLKSEGCQMRSYCYVADCASGILTVLIKGKNGEAYNIANRDARVTIADFAKITAQTAECKLRFEIPTAEDIANRTPIQKQVLDSHKLEQFGWKGIYSVEKGILHTLLILKNTSGMEYIC
uniref:NAD-dependent epimerase/dehydratase family protein n=1 Tax=Agathobacter sp. TaxID=2021311 RepID=UPI004056F7C7